VSTSLVDHAGSDRPSALSVLTKGGLAAVARSLGEISDVVDAILYLERATGDLLVSQSGS
jgi:hypothetical protein